MFFFSVFLGVILGALIGAIFYIGGLFTGFFNDQQLKLIIPIWTIGGLIVGICIFLSDFLGRK